MKISKYLSYICIVALLFHITTFSVYAGDNENDFNATKTHINSIQVTNPSLPSNVTSQRGSVGEILQRLFDAQGRIGNWYIKAFRDVQNNAVLRWSGGRDGLFAVGSIFDTGTNVGIGTPSPSPLLKLDVAGKIGAQEFCDAGGVNCFGAADVSLSGSTVGGGGTTNYVAKFTDAVTLGNSSIIDDGVNVGIGVNPSYKLDVFGTINATGFRGNGSQLTNINASNISSGTIGDARLPTSIVRTSGNQTIGGTKTFSSTISGDITGNAGTATSLETPRTIGFSGVISGSQSFDGSANITIATSLADNSITSAKIVDSSITSSDILPDTLTAGDIAADAIGSSELANNAVASANIIDGTIVNADVNASAAIAGTKINPNFGSQDIVTTGNITAGGARYDSDGEIITRGEGRNMLILQTDSNSSERGISFRNSGGAYSNSIYAVDAGGNDTDLRIAGGDATSTLGALDDYVTIRGGTSPNAGNVGIGETAPSEKLEVEGNIKSSGLLWSAFGNTGTHRGVLLENFDDTANANAVELATKLGGTEASGLRWVQESPWTSGSAASAKDTTFQIGVLQDNIPTFPVSVNSAGNMSIAGTLSVGGGINGDDITDNTIDSSEIQNGSITSADILDNTIAAIDIAPDAIGASELANNSVASANIINGSVTTNDIANNTITETDISDSFVARDSNLLDGLNSTDFIRSDIADTKSNELTIDNSGYGNHLRLTRLTQDWELTPSTDGSLNFIQNAGGGQNRVEVPGLESNARITVGGTNVMLWGDSGDNIQNGTIDSSEIQDNTLTAVDIAPDAIGASELANNSVASANIINGAIVDADINSSAAIAGTKINPNFGSQNIVTTGNGSFGGNVTGASLNLSATNTSGAPGRTTAINITGYEGRGKGMFIYDTSNSDEWFIGEGYDYNGIGIGLDSVGSQSEYLANAKFRLDTSGNATIAGTLSVGGGINGDDITDNTIDSSEIQNGSITSADILDNTIAAIDIAPDAIGASELANNSVASANIINGSVTTNDIANNTITETDISDSFVARNSQLLDGIDSTAFVRDTGNESIGGFKTFTDTIRSGNANSTQGQTIIEGNYSGNNVAITLGGHYATAAATLGYGVRTKTGGSGYISSADNVAWSRGAIEMTNQLIFKNAPSATVAIGTDVAMTERFRVDASGNLTISGTMGGDSITNGTIDSSEIQNGTIAAIDLATNSITSDKILNGEVTSLDINNNTITEDDISDSFVARDSNLLDGIDSASFIRADANDNVTGHTEWQDSQEVRLGAGADLRLFHNGANSYIRNYTGNTEFRSLSHGSTMYFQGEDAGGVNRNMIQMDPDNYVRLYYAGSEKLRTIGSGVQITGTVTASDPTAASHLATKNYVDTLVTQGVTWKAPVESGQTVVGTWGACNASKQSWTTYNKNDDIIYICDGSAWISIGSSASVPYATTSSAGKIQIAGDLQGTWNNITLKNGVVDAAAIAADAVGVSELANNSVASANIINGTIVAGDIANDTITATQIAANAIGNSELQDDITVANLTATNGQGIAWENGVNRITNNDGGGNVQIRFGHDHTSSDERFTHGGTAYYIGGDMDSNNGTLQMKVATNGGAGNDQAVSWGPTFAVGESSLTWNGNDILTDASNIDADTLDGFDSTAFIQVGTSGDQIQDNTIDSSEIQNGTIVNADIGSLDASKITSGTIGLARLPNDLTSKIPWITTSTELYGTYVGFGGGSDTVIASGEAKNAYEGSTANRDSETLRLISDNSIEFRTNIQNASWDSAPVASIDTSGNLSIAGTMSGDSITNGTIDSTEIQDNTLTAADIAADAIGASELANNSVASANIINGTVTTNDIANNTITETDISDAFVARDSNLLDGIDSAAFLRSNTNDTMAGKLTISNAAQSAGSNAFSHLELYAPNSGSSANEISMRFHQGSQYYNQIRVRAGGFRFTEGNSDTLSNISVATPTGNDHAATKGYVDGQVGNYIRNDVDDTFLGKLSVGNTNNRRAGIYGIYDSTKIGHIWSMGTAYQIPQDGSNFGNLYGLAYKHTNNPTGGTMAGGHQMVWTQNGVPNSAMGTNIWTSGAYVSDGTTVIDSSAWIVGDRIQQNSVDSSEIQDNTLTASDIAPDAIGASELANNSVASANIINGTVTASDLAANSVGDSELIDQPTVTQLNITAGTDNGIKFWGSDSYEIAMGNSANYRYGPVTDYSIKMNMSNTAGRGWTWGRVGLAPLTALEATTGNFQTAGSVTAASFAGNGTSITNINGDNIQNGTIDSSEIQNNTLTAADLAPNSVGNSEMIDSPTFTTLTVNGSITSPEGTLRDDGGGWVRTYGNTGWYNNTYGGGWNMTDTTWIRSYGSKDVYINTMLRADNGFQVDGTTVIDGSAWVIGDRIQQNSVDSSEIQNGTLTAADLAANSVAASEIAANAVAASEIAANAVGNSELNNSDSFEVSRITVGNGGGAVALTYNDGGGNANLTFNHTALTPDSNGNAGRITVNVDATSNASMGFQLKSNVTSGTSVGASQVFTLYEDGDIYLNGTSRMIDNVTCIGNCF